MPRFTIEKLNSLGDLYLYDNVAGAESLVHARDAKELRLLLNEYFGLPDPDCAPCKAIHHLHTEPPAQRLHVRSTVPTGTGFLTRCAVCHEVYDSPEEGCSGEPRPALDPDEVRQALEWSDVNPGLATLRTGTIHAAARAWLRIQDAAEQERRETEQFQRDMEAAGEKLRARRERIATAVMAGLAADPGSNNVTVTLLAQVAVEWADGLIKELDEQPSSSPFDKG